MWFHAPPDRNFVLQAPAVTATPSMWSPFLTLALVLTGTYAFLAALFAKRFSQTVYKDQGR
jgi:hypothetical protein